MHSPPRERRGGWRRPVSLALGPALAAAVLVSPAPANLSAAGWRVAAVAVLMAVWWIGEAIPISATALLPLVLFPALGVFAVDEAAAPFANPVIFLFLGGFLVAAALSRCGLHRRAALAIIRAGGTRPANLVGGFMAATAALSLWVSNTATVAMMLPMALSVLALGESQEEDAAAGAASGPGGGEPNLAPALLLGLAYAASLGGLGTLIGTPPNALLAGFLAETYGLEVGFGRWMLLGVPLVAVSLPLTWWLLTRWLYPLGRAPLAGGREAIRRQIASLGAPTRAEWAVGVVTAATAAAWIFRPLLERVVPGLSDAGIAVAGALVLFLLPVALPGGGPLLDWETAEKLPWGVLVLFGGGLSLARGIDETGLAAWIGAALGGLAALPPLVVIAVVTAVVVLLTELTSNTATAAAFLPVTASLALALGADPLLLAVPTALAASCAFMLPVATPPNAIVYGSGRLTLPQMARAGWALNLLMIVLVTLAAWLLAPVVLGGR